MPTTRCEEEILTMLKKWIMRKTKRTRGLGLKGSRLKPQSLSLEWGALDIRGVYGPAIGRLREDFWGGIGDNQGIVAGPMVFRGGATQSLLPRIVSDTAQFYWTVEERGRGLPLLGSFSFTLFEKLKALKACLKEQNSRKQALEKYEKWVLMEETSWRQKLRELWLREGDKNIGYFHKMANAHKRVNSMVKIKINGVWVSKDSDIKEGVVQAFHSLLSETDEWRPRCNGL
ncbi:hypothetical protein CK203_071707 [Vitis vinifera]|uniref:Uncharacterized protein n=1 Tax=Vitis vinifera TaxID=29760 RepID=A0A438C347_VITVI|nr:hypothetical protein CK203_071707 [Vitis vinifera]